MTEEDDGTSQGYTYDENGNRTMTGYVQGPANRLVYDGQYAYNYDDEGNMTWRGDNQSGYTMEFAYDHRNRLTHIQERNPGGTVLWELAYAYDTFNRRVSRAETVNTLGSGGEGGGTVIVDSETTAERYIYDGQHVVLDFYQPDGGDFDPVRRYLYGPSIDQILAQENVAPLGVAVLVTAAGRVYWFLTDNLGTVRDILDHDGNIVEHFRYDAWGNLAEGDTGLTRYLYTAREFDPVTGLQYNRNRWYDPRLGRWLSEDPIGFAAGDTNLYRYIFNSPTNGTDPSGLQSLGEWFNDPVWGATNRDLWNRTASLRVSGGEGASSNDCSNPCGGAGGGSTGGGFVAAIWAGPMARGSTTVNYLRAGFAAPTKTSQSTSNANTDYLPPVNSFQSAPSRQSVLCRGGNLRPIDPRMAYPPQPPIWANPGTRPPVHRPVYTGPTIGAYKPPAHGSVQVKGMYIMQYNAYKDEWVPYEMYLETFNRCFAWIGGATGQGGKPIEPVPIGGRGNPAN